MIDFSNYKWSSGVREILLGLTPRIYAKTKIQYNDSGEVCLIIDIYIYNKRLQKSLWSRKDQDTSVFTDLKGKDILGHF